MSFASPRWSRARDKNAYLCCVSCVSFQENGQKYLLQEKPDAMVLQETKCGDKQIPKEVANIPGYFTYFQRFLPSHPSLCFRFRLEIPFLKPRGTTVLTRAETDCLASRDRQARQCHAHSFISVQVGKRATPASPCSLRRNH